MIQLRNLNLDIGTRHIFDNISGVFQESDHVGIIGRNGAGKSTLLKIIAGLVKPTSGDVSIFKGTHIAYLPQEEVLASTLSVFEEAFSAFGKAVTAQKRIDELEKMLETGSADEDLVQEYADLQVFIQTFEKHKAIQQTNEVLAGLGFTEKVIQKKVSELSTGWKMRLALAKLLLTDADIFLFDEPTNHLDIVTQEWFLQKLQSMRAGFLLVSHDRAYLDKACTSIFELERGQGTFYRGNLESYLQKKEENIAIARATRAQQERDISTKLKTAERFRAGTRASQAQALFKQVARIELVEVEPPLPVIHFSFPTPPRSGSVVLTFTDLSFEFNQTLLFKNVSGEIQRGDRVALVAANGVGKTTLINCLRGIYTPKTGHVKYGHNVQVAFFEQDQARTLDNEKTIFEEVNGACPQITDAEIRRTLGSFQFSGDDIHKKIKILSGGEKNRVAMVKVLLQRANFLILDEPTNHLDLYAKDVLCQALTSYEGTILFVSHDIDFVNKLASKIMELTPLGAYSYPGTYGEFLAAKKAQQQSDLVSLEKKKEPAHGEPEKKVVSAQDIRMVRKQIAECEKNVASLERKQTQEVEHLSKYAYGSPEYTRTEKALAEIIKKLEQEQRTWEDLMTQFDGREN